MDRFDSGEKQNVHPKEHEHTAMGPGMGRACS